MLKVLILGATGMLGHKLYQVLRPSADVVGTIRSGYKIISRYNFLEPTILIPRFDALQPDAPKQVIESIQPDVVVNCIGVINKLVEKTDIDTVRRLNTELPHALYRICKPRGVRLIHISTDCVFTGKKGRYTEDDIPDATDIYGSTKALGELKEAEALTLRTSIVGRELHSSNGLLEWFISQKGGEVEGWTNAVFSGFPTLHLSRIIADVVNRHPSLSGLYNVASEPISKFELLSLINQAFGLNIVIKEAPEPKEDKSLDASKFNKATGFTPLPWPQMIKEMAEDAAPYSKWR